MLFPFLLNRDYNAPLWVVWRVTVITNFALNLLVFQHYDVAGINYILHILAQIPHIILSYCWHNFSMNKHPRINSDEMGNFWVLWAISTITFAIFYNLVMGVVYEAHWSTFLPQICFLGASFMLALWYDSYQADAKARDHENSQMEEGEMLPEEIVYDLEENQEAEGESSGDVNTPASSSETSTSTSQ